MGFLQGTKQHLALQRGRVRGTDGSRPRSERANRAHAGRKRGYLASHLDAANHLGSQAAWAPRRRGLGEKRSQQRLTEPSFEGGCSGACLLRPGFKSSNPKGGVGDISVVWVLPGTSPGLQKSAATLELATRPTKMPQFTYLQVFAGVHRENRNAFSMAGSLCGFVGPGQGCRWTVMLDPAVHSSRWPWVAG